MGRIPAWRTTGPLLAGCVLLGFNYVYYAFFGCFFIALGAAAGYVTTGLYTPAPRRRRRDCADCIVHRAEPRSQPLGIRPRGVASPRTGEGACGGGSLWLEDPTTRQSGFRAQLPAVSRLDEARERRELSVGKREHDFAACSYRIARLHGARRRCSGRGVKGAGAAPERRPTGCRRTPSGDDRRLRQPVQSLRIAGHPRL